MPTLGFDDFEIDLDLFTLTRNGVQIEIGARTAQYPHLPD